MWRWRRRSRRGREEAGRPSFNAGWVSSLLRPGWVSQSSATAVIRPLGLFNFLPGELGPLQSLAIRIGCGLAVPIAFVFTFNRDFSQALVVGPLVGRAFELDYVYAVHFFIRQKLAITEQL
jgi:hypothetical protein